MVMLDVVAFEARLADVFGHPPAALVRGWWPGMDDDVRAARRRWDVDQAREAVAMSTLPEGPIDGCLVGTCVDCGQQLLLTEEDCWHPHNVDRACPPEPTEILALMAWYEAGNRTLRPGREKWRPA